MYSKTIQSEATLGIRTIPATSTQHVSLNGRDLGGYDPNKGAWSNPWLAEAALKLDSEEQLRKIEAILRNANISRLQSIHRAAGASERSAGHECSLLARSDYELIASLTPLCSPARHYQLTVRSLWKGAKSPDEAQVRWSATLDTAGLRQFRALIDQALQTDPFSFEGERA